MQRLHAVRIIAHARVRSGSVLGSAMLKRPTFNEVPSVVVSRLGQGQAVDNFACFRIYTDASYFVSVIDDLDLVKDARP